MRDAILAPVLAVACALAFSTATAQQSASFKLTEHAMNAGGHPADGVVLGSTSYRIRLDAIGDSVVAAALSSASFHMDAGFVSAYPPPGEVQAVRFTGKTGLSWDPEKSTGVYNLYRSPVSALPGDYGACLQGSVASASASDAQSPVVGAAYFYLVTAENRLGEEGTRGYASGGTERIGTPCP